MPGILSSARQFCAICGHLSTAKHGRSFFGALARLTVGQPWMPAAV